MDHLFGVVFILEKRPVQFPLESSGGSNDSRGKETLSLDWNLIEIGWHVHSAMDVAHQITRLATLDLIVVMVVVNVSIFHHASAFTGDPTEALFNDVLIFSPHIWRGSSR